MHQRLIAWCLLAFLLVPAPADATGVQTSLDRSSISLGETVTLNLHLQGNVDNVAMPDLSALGSDFDILGTSQNSSLSVVNGAATSELVVGVVLRPRHAGTLQIPSLDVAGSRTAPLQVDVTATNPADNVPANRDVFMESQIEPNHAYVGQQLSYVVRLFFATSISDGSLDAPELNGLQFNKIGDDVNYSVARGGRQYRVLERRYAWIPQHAGHIDVPALRFQGETIDPADPDSFFGARKPVMASAPVLSIDVKPTPADWGASAWLPARQLSLTLDGLPDAHNPLRAGQPLNLTMNLQATGLPAESLPALSLPPLDGATVYPDKPTTSSRNDGPWIVGQRQQAFAIVPNRAGTFNLPATTLKWWDVLADRMQVAQIPARSFTVLPAIGGLDVHTANPASATTVAAASAPVATPAPTPWRWIALGSLALWLLSALTWLLWRAHRRRRPAVMTSSVRSVDASARERQLAFLAAARDGDAAAQVRSLLAWARAERPTVLHLGDLVALLDDERQREAIASLQHRHYAGTPIAGGGNPKLVEVFKRGFIWRLANKGDQPDDLPPLYPFKLH